MAKRKINVALADDHTIVRKGIKEIINSFQEFEVLTDVINGKLLIEYLENNNIHPEICVLDINMPEMDGYKTATIIRQRWPKIKILALSMYDNEYNIVKMLKSGANGYVLKDTSTIELHNALISIHENSYYHSEIVSGSVINMIRNGQNDNTLNDKELELLSHICSDLTYKEIGELMHVSGRTVEGYRNSLFQKLNLRTRTGLALFALKIGACK